MKLSLKVLTAGKTCGQIMPINSTQFLIGRDPKCNLRPASASISKLHCALLIKAGKVYLKDFSSTNGTFIDDQPIQGVVVLQNHNILRLGPLTFEVLLEAPAHAAEARPEISPAGDDSAADLLLAEDEESPAEAPQESAPDDEAGVPGGSTVLDVPALDDADQKDEGEADKPKAPPEPSSTRKHRALINLYRQQRKKK
jgi:predicted component of type VI protein secretion system